jgi:hypothetical protein
VTGEWLFVNDESFSVLPADTYTRPSAEGIAGSCENFLSLDAMLVGTSVI